MDYTIQRFEEELRAKLEGLSGELETLRRRKHALEVEVAHLTEALVTAEGGRAPAVVIARSTKTELLRHV